MTTATKPAMHRLFDGSPAPYTPETCPNAGRLMFWGPDLDGRHGDSQTLYCHLCGAPVTRQRYPEESRQHPTAADSRLSAEAAEHMEAMIGPQTWPINQH
jgi:hypothetical protein